MRFPIARSPGAFSHGLRNPALHKPRYDILEIKPSTIPGKHVPEPSLSLNVFKILFLNRCTKKVYNSVSFFFQNLGLGASDSDSFIAASQPENKSKNRYAILPCELKRFKYSFQHIVKSITYYSSFPMIVESNNAIAIVTLSACACLERVSIVSRKTKTKVTTLANQKRQRQSSKPIKTRSNYT